MIFDIQKASLTKRLVAFILDMILFAVLAVGFAWLIGLCCDYDGNLDANIYTQEAHTTYYQRAYGIDFSKEYDKLTAEEKVLWDTYAEQFSEAVTNDAKAPVSLEKLLSYHTKYFAPRGIDIFTTSKEYDAFTAEQKAKWLEAYELSSKEFKQEFGANALLMKPITYAIACEEEHEVSYTVTDAEREFFTNNQTKRWNNAYEECDKFLSKDLGYGERTMRIVAYTLLMVSLGILLSMLVLEFAIPLIFKNGQTVGKKVFGIAVIHQNGVRVNTITMFIRTFLGKYAVETMCPVLLLLMLFTGNALIAVIVMGLLVIFEIVLFIWQKDTRPFIHDVFAKTVCVDLASQMIFDNEAEMAEFRRNAYAESSGDSAKDTLYGTSNPLSSSFVEIKKDNPSESDKD